MGLKTFTTDFVELSKDSYLRNDEKFHIFLYSTNWNLFSVKNENLISLNEILIEDCKNFDFREDEEYKGIPTGQNYIDKDGDIKDFLPITIDNRPNRLKYKITTDNILISSLRLAKTPALSFENENLSDFVFSNGFYIFRVKENWNKKFVLYILKNKKLKSILDNNIYRGIGISAYKKEDLLKIKIPKIPIKTQNKIVSKIEPIEKEIKKLKSQIKPSEKIINKIFAKEFCFDLEKFQKMNLKKNYEIEFSYFGNNKDLRNSVKFHRKTAQFVLSELQKITDKKIKDFISEPIVLGKGISPKEYDENGEYYYISMANIKSWCFDFTDSQLVSKDFSDKNKSKTVAKNDILIARSGEGTIGKTALIEHDNFKGIFADFTMCIRLKNYNYLFAYYYFRSKYFQFLVEINKKGLGNNTNIFPSQICEFPIPNISLSRQQQIVDKIKNSLDNQNLINEKINEKREKIDEIIEEAIIKQS